MSPPGRVSPGSSRQSLQALYYWRQKLSMAQESEGNVESSAFVPIAMPSGADAIAPKQ